MIYENKRFLWADNDISNSIPFKPKYHVEQVVPLAQTHIVNPARYRARSLPIAGALLREVDRGEEQMTLL